MSNRAYASLFGMSNFWAMQREALPILADRAERFMAGFSFEPPEAPKVSNGVAIMPLIGAMTPRGDMGTVSTMRFDAYFREAVKNPGIKGIMLDVDSPGGSVYYTKTLSDRIFEARKSGKPIIAFGNGSVGSAAYWVASAASKFILAPGAEAGSVGVWMAHQDMSKALEQQGVAVSIISYGENKLEGSELGPLSEETRAHMQSRVDAMGAEFESDVARNRGVNVSTVRKEFGQGRMYGDKEALSRGMIDGIGNAEKVLKELMGGTPVSYTRKAAASQAEADDDLIKEWMAAAESVIQAEIETWHVEAESKFITIPEGAKLEWVAGDTGPTGGDPDLLRRKLALKERE